MQKQTSSGRRLATGSVFGNTLGHRVAFDSGHEKMRVFRRHDSGERICGRLPQLVGVGFASGSRLCFGLPVALTLTTDCRVL